MSFDEEIRIGAGASQIATLVLSKLKKLFSAPNTSSAVVHASIALTVDSKFWTHPNLGHAVSYSNECRCRILIRYMGELREISAKGIASRSVSISLADLLERPASNR